MNLFLGNFIGLLASLLMVYVGFVKVKKKILFIQTIQIALSTVSNLVLGGVTGAIINILNCIRNILCYYDRLNLMFRLIIIVFSVILSVSFNNIGLIGYLPVISTVIYTLFMNVKDVKKFKYLIIFSMTMWFIYDLYINAYVTCIFDFFSILSNFISILKLKTKK